MERLRRSARPYAVPLIAATVLLTIVDGVANRSMSNLVPVTTCLYALLVMETYWWPAFGSFGVVAIAVTAALTPRIILPMPVWSLWFVYGMLAYRRKHAALAVTLLLGVAGTAGGVMLGRYPLWNMASIVSLDGSFCLAALAGYALVERGRIEEAKRVAAENARMKRDLELGSRIHDSVTQGLTVIALTAEREAASADAAASDGSDKAWDLVARTARATLGQLREVIDILGGRQADAVSDQSVIPVPVEASVESPGMKDYPAAVRALAHSGDDRLHALGFGGQTVVEVDRSGVGADMGAADAGAVGSADAWREVLDLLGQLYTNIAGHADPHGGDYALRVTVAEERVTIVQSNGVAVDSDENAPGAVPHAGRGLALHRRRVAALGGTLHTSLEDGVWVLSATVPLASARRRGDVQGRE
ncbi:histidine kinase [Bifidobacterium avesanii]|nr:histidine kinase [Bifidobacterium avesanii]